MRNSTIVFAWLAVTSAVSAYADFVELPRVEGDVEIDGVIEEAFWQEALRVEIDVETTPGENIEAPVETWAYLAEDGENIYVAFDARDPNPEEIRAYLRDRDTAWPDDFVGVHFDTYNDNRRAFEFFANPFGIQMDAVFSESGDGDGGDDSWDAIWDSAGRITETGYIVEMKIPLDQLRFQSVDGKQTWGFRLMRQYPRTHETFIESVPFNRNSNCNMCDNDRLQGLAGSKPGKDFEIVPTLTASHSRTSDDPGFIPLGSADTRTEAGVTVRYGITPDITANLAINPDFSQVEADAAQLDINNRFALFFPEKRPFFLEGANYFETPLDAVFTRTVASPEVGLKLTGKRGNHTFGTFAARDDITNVLLPGATSSDSTTIEQANDTFVGRYSYGFGDTGSSVGGLMTARDGVGYRNIVTGVDGRWRINDQHSITGQFLRSEAEYPLDVAIEFDQPLDSFSGNAVGIEYEYSSRNWFASLEHEKFDSGFRADSGFIPRVGGEEQEVVFGRVWHGTNNNWWTRIRLRNGYEITHREDGQKLEEEASIRLGMGGRWQSWTQLNLIKGKVYNDGIVHDVDRIGVYNNMRPVRGLFTEVFVGVGQRVDFANNRPADSIVIEPRIEWNATRNLLLEINGIYLKLDTRAGEKIFDASILDARAVWQFNVRSFLRFTLQHQDIKRNPDVYIDPVDRRSKESGRQLLYSWKLNPQTVFFLGYSDAYIDNDDLNELTASDRSWFLKIGYAWSL